MGIKCAKTAGFCYGVKRAVDEAYRMADGNIRFATLGELIHNKFVVDDLEAHGIRTYDSVSDIPDGTKGYFKDARCC